MTGGQHNEGDLTPDRIARELQAMGVKRHRRRLRPEGGARPQGLPRGPRRWHERDELIAVQEKMRGIKGVSAIIYIQTCAAEKRRRRKRGQFPDPDKRVFINTDVCEGCGDCGVQSNCVSIVPVETELGRKRAIDQSSCNKDFSCLKGFCPSFVTVEGAKIRKEATARASTSGDLPAPDPAGDRRDLNVVVTGVGGTGVVTIGAILAMAAHLDGKGAGMMEMAGLAQKGGAVHIHCRLAEPARGHQRDPRRHGRGRCADRRRSRGQRGREDARPDPARAGPGAVVNSHEIITGDFTRDPEFRIPARPAGARASGAAAATAATLFDASELARVLLGDSIYSNMMVLRRGLAARAGAAVARRRSCRRSS